MHRFFLRNDQKIIVNTCFIPDKLLKHQLKHVLRLKNFEDIIVVPQEGQEYLSNFDGEKICIKKLLPSNNLDFNNLILIQGIPKNSKQKIILQKATELNAKEIIFWNSMRSIAKFKDFNLKKANFINVLIEAAEQSGRINCPHLRYIEQIKDFNFFQKDDLIIVAYEHSNSDLRSCLNNIKQYHNIYLIVGPEGGLDKQEIDFFTNYNAKIVSLGGQILRTETAAIGLMFFIQIFLQ